MARWGKDELRHLMEEKHREDETRVRRTLRDIDVNSLQLPSIEYIWRHGSYGGKGYRMWDMAAPLFSIDLLRAAYHDLRIYPPGPDTYRLVGRLLEQTGVTIPTESHASVRNSGKEGSYCPKAELYFYGSWLQVLSGHRYGHDKITVYHTPDGEPVLLRKRSDASTALTLQPMEMEGMPLVPGTIVTPQYLRGNTMTGEKVFGRTSDRYRLQTYELPADIALGLGRLSAWAFDDAETRMLFATSCFGGKFDADPIRARYLAETSLNDFQIAARHIMELCGVTPQLAGEEAVAEWSTSPVSLIPRTLAG